MNPDTLLEVLELGNLTLPWLPGRADPVPLPGAVGRSTPISSPFVNLLAMVRTEDPEGWIDGALAHYGDRAFSVVTGPLTRPADLGERLRARGFRLLTGYRGLALTDLAAPIDAPDDVVVEEIGIEAIDALDHVKAVAFDMPPAAARWIDELLLSALGGRVRVYLARGRDEVGWTAFGQGWYAPGAPVLVLGGGGVLPGSRGRGLFRALVKRRLADARADGVEAAVIQAMDHTSAPILLRLGFRELVRMQMWTNAPA